MFARRALLWFVAFMPVVWGNCPYWFVGYPPGDARAAAGGSTVPGCPCCHSKAPRGKTPTPRGCDGDCPMTVARRGVTPAGPAVVAPAAEVPSLRIEVDAPFHPEALAPDPLRNVRPPGPPPHVLASVVLLI